MSFYDDNVPTIPLNSQYQLREHLINDVENFFNYYSQAEVHRYIISDIPTNIIEAAAEMQYCYDLFYQKKGIFWSISETKTNTMIGAIGLYMKDSSTIGEISFDLNPRYWRQGIMHASLLKVVDFAFKKIQLNQISAIVHPKNYGSIKLLQKIGFGEAILHEKARIHHDESHDIVILKLLYADKNNS